MKGIRPGQAVAVKFEALAATVHQKLLEHGLMLCKSRNLEQGLYPYANKNNRIVLFLKYNATMGSVELIVCLHSTGCFAVQALVKDLQLPFHARYMLPPMFGHDLNAIEKAAVVFRQKHPETLVQVQKDCLVVIFENSALYLARDPSSGRVLADLRIDEDCNRIDRVLQTLNCGASWLSELGLACMQHPTQLLGQKPEEPRDLVIAAYLVSPASRLKANSIAHKIHNSICDVQGQLHTVVAGGFTDIFSVSQDDLNVRITLLLRCRATSTIADAYKNLIQAIFVELFVDMWFEFQIAPPELDRREFARRYNAKAGNTDVSPMLYARPDVALHTRQQQTPTATMPPGKKPLHGYAGK